MAPLQLPDVPAIVETYPGFDNTIWIRLFAPARVPEGLVSRLCQEVEKALRSPDLIESFYKAGGIEPMITPLEEMQGQIKRDLNLKVD